MNGIPAGRANSVIESIDHANARAAALRPKVGGFPYLAEALRQAGVTKYYFDIPSMTVIYVTDEGDLLQPGTFLRTAKTVIPAYDEDAVIDAIRVDQRGESTFPDFLAASFRAGVIRFEVDAAARTCTYFGAHAETYLEEYPAVHLAPVTTSRA
jgi:uncharacterized protein YbcV (DUF1398 family)